VEGEGDGDLVGAEELLILVADWGVGGNIRARADGIVILLAGLIWYCFRLERLPAAGWYKRVQCIIVIADMIALGLGYGTRKLGLWTADLSKHLC
jgi:hypothetical protein